MNGGAKKDAPRPDLTAAVLLWVWDGMLADDQWIRLDGEADQQKDRIVKATASELRRLALIDAMGTPTKEGRRLLGLI